MSSPTDTACTQPHAVYRCYDVDGTLLYVGCCREVAARMHHHLQICNIGKEPNGSLIMLLDHYAVDWYANKVEARKAERQAILTEAPVLNRQHNTTRFRKGADRCHYEFVGTPHPISAWAFGPPTVTPAFIMDLRARKSAEPVETRQLRAS